MKGELIKYGIGERNRLFAFLKRVAINRRPNNDVETKLLHTWDCMSEMNFLLFESKAWKNLEASNAKIHTLGHEGGKTAKVELSLMKPAVKSAKDYFFYLSSENGKEPTEQNCLEAISALHAVCMGCIGGPIIRGLDPVDFIVFGPALSSPQPKVTLSRLKELVECYEPSACRKLSDEYVFPWSSYLMKDLTKPINLDAKNAILGNEAKSLVQTLNRKFDMFSGIGISILLESRGLGSDGVKEIKEGLSEERALSIVDIQCADLDWIDMVIKESYI